MESAQEPPPAIQTAGLTKLYRGIPAVDHLDLTVPAGEVFGFLGRNGAGKTTTIKMLLGLARPTSGTARVLGRNPGPAESRRDVGYLPELFRYQGWMRAGEVARFHCRLARVPRTDADAEIERVLSLVGLLSHRNGRVATFSKGMQQRLGLGLALLGNPKLILLDEPTSALDPVGRHDVRSLIGRLAAAGTTVFLNTHLLSEVERTCHRVAIIEKGSVVAQGPIDDLLKGTTEVRIRLIEPSPAQTDLLRQAGATRDDEWFSLHDVDDDAVASLVSEVVAAGGRVAAINHVRRDLEQRFLELVGEGRE
jgi:ABC-2 type transport system ATP-binding protein